jgi:hypothetical protein
MAVYSDTDCVTSTTRIVCDDELEARSLSSSSSDSWHSSVDDEDYHRPGKYHRDCGDEEYNRNYDALFHPKKGLKKKQTDKENSKAPFPAGMLKRYRY